MARRVWVTKRQPDLLTDFQKAVSLLQNADRLRKHDGTTMTITELAERVGCSRPTIYKYIAHPDEMPKKFIQSAASAYDDMIDFQDILRIIDLEDERFKRTRLELIDLIQKNAENATISDYTMSVVLIMLENLKEENLVFLRTLIKQLPSQGK